MNTNQSTGPRTPQGKARAAANAVKHGFSGRTMIVRDDERAEHAAFLAEWERELQPQGAVEKELFGQIVAASWTLRRLSAAEAALIDDSLEDPLVVDAAAARLRLYSLYQSRQERAFHKALAELRRVQEERLVREACHSTSARDAAQQPPQPTLPRLILVRRTAADAPRPRQFPPGQTNSPAA